VFTLAFLLGLLQIGSTPARRSDAGRGAAQTPAAGDSQASGDRTHSSSQSSAAGINFVRVDVIVTDKKGQQVTRPQAVGPSRSPKTRRRRRSRRFRLDQRSMAMAGGRSASSPDRNVDDAEVELAKDDVRLFVIFFDDYPRASGQFAVGQGNRWSRFRAASNCGPTNVDGASSIRSRRFNDIDFTRNPETVLSAINNFKGRKFDYTPMNQFEEQYARYPTEVVEQVRNDVVMTALRGLSTRLSAVLREARKSIIFVSEGSRHRCRHRCGGADATMPADPRVTGGMLGENSQREQTAEFFGQSDLYSRMRDVFAAATRNNAAFYSLDHAGSRRSSSTSTRAPVSRPTSARCRRPPTRCVCLSDET
jgi:hypothetical protein